MNWQDPNRRRIEVSPTAGSRNLGGAPDPTGAAPPEQALERMSLRDLTETADVSVRTVRYYISEGLLPPPEGAGPGSTYTPAHLDRLRLIHQLKAAYLPLREIRRRLSGLDDEDVRALLDGDRVAAEPLKDFDATSDPLMADAREYLTMMESGQTYHTEPLGLALPPAAPVPPSARLQRPRHRPDSTITAAQAPRPAQDVASTLWHRIPLGDDAELVISDEAYARHPDRVDWLVRWARKVFG